MNLTTSQLDLLRAGCGLGKFTRKPKNTQTTFAGYNSPTKNADIADLLQRGLLVEKFTFGPGGKSVFYEMTLEAQQLAIDANEAQHG